MPDPAGKHSITHNWVRDLVKWGTWGWRFCRELKVHLDMLPALILRHLGSETGAGCTGLREMSIWGGRYLHLKQWEMYCLH